MSAASTQSPAPASASEAAHTAVVTGGTGGLGEPLVRVLHAKGFRVAVVGTRAEPAAALAAQLDPEGRTARGYGADISDKSAVQGLLEQVAEDFGSVEVLVNNAARTQAKPLMEITPEELHAVVSVNFYGVFYASQVFGSRFAEQGYGRIINVASLAGQNGGTATGGHYASSKGAVLSATKVFARELAPSGVTVNAISPGPLESPMVREIVGENLEGFVQNIPVKELGSPEFIAEMTALLASPAASSVTGACWDANGGLFLR